MIRLLIVDDDDVVREELAFELELRGYEIVQFGHADAALQYLQSEGRPPDAIISDLVLRDRGGYELLSAVRARVEWATIPFIFLSVCRTNENVRIAKQLGADDYLTKPFELDDLLITLESRLMRAEQWKALLAHRLSTPNGPTAESLFPASASLESLEEDLDGMPDEFSQKALEALRTYKYSLAHLVEQITLLSQFDYGHIGAAFPSEARPCKLQSVVSAAEQSLRIAFGTERVSVEATFPDQSIYVLGWRDLLARALSEVLRNAILFSVPGVPVHITVGTDSKQALVQITNTGIGINADCLPILFERFTQCHHTGDPAQGVGLGLALVYEILRLHDGTITVESVPRAQTTFIIQLPLYAVE